MDGARTPRLPLALKGNLTVPNLSPIVLTGLAVCGACFALGVLAGCWLLWMRSREKK